MSESNGFEVVARPGPRVRDKTGLTSALRRTAITGQAVRLPDRKQLIGGTYITTLRAEGLRVRQRRDGDHLIVWAEKREPAPDGAGGTR